MRWTVGPLTSGTHCIKYAKCGDTVFVRLVDNRTTPFRWHIVETENLMVSEKFEGPQGVPDGICGSAGVLTYVCTVTGPRAALRCAHTLIGQPLPDTGSCDLTVTFGRQQQEDN